MNKAEPSSRARAAGGKMGRIAFVAAETEAALTARRSLVATYGIARSRTPMSSWRSAGTA